MKHTLSKFERLCHVKVIDELFDRSNPANKSFSIYPIRVVYAPRKTTADELGFQHRVLFSVSKRAFKRAVDRNLLKRRIREGYRLQKHLLSEYMALNISLMYVSKSIEESSVIHEAIEKILLKILKDAK